MTFGLTLTALVLGATFAVSLYCIIWASRDRSATIVCLVMYTGALIAAVSVFLGYNMRSPL